MLNWSHFAGLQFASPNVLFHTLLKMHAHDHKAHLCKEHMWISSAFSNASLLSSVHLCHSPLSTFGQWALGKRFMPLPSSQKFSMCSAIGGELYRLTRHFVWDLFIQWSNPGFWGCIHHSSIGATVTLTQTLNLSQGSWICVSPRNLDGSILFTSLSVYNNLCSWFVCCRLLVVALQEKIAAFDACTLKSCFCITS